MPKRTFTPEQIVGKLRQMEVLISQGKTVSVVRSPNIPGRNVSAGDVIEWPPLWRRNALRRVGRAVLGEWRGAGF
jgi:hypothetical protein